MSLTDDPGEDAGDRDCEPCAKKVFTADGADSVCQEAICKECGVCKEEAREYARAIQSFQAHAKSFKEACGVDEDNSPDATLSQCMVCSPECQAQHPPHKLPDQCSQLFDDPVGEEMAACMEAHALTLHSAAVIKEWSRCPEHCHEVCGQALAELGSAAPEELGTATPQFRHVAEILGSCPITSKPKAKMSIDACAREVFAADSEAKVEEVCATDDCGECEACESLAIEHARELRELVAASRSLMASCGLDSSHDATISNCLLCDESCQAESVSAGEVGERCEDFFSSPGLELKACKSAHKHIKHFNNVVRQWTQCGTNCRAECEQAQLVASQQTDQPHLVEVRRIAAACPMGAS